MSTYRAVKVQAVFIERAQKELKRKYLKDGIPQEPTKELSVNFVMAQYFRAVDNVDKKK